MPRATEFLGKTIIESIKIFFSCIPTRINRNRIMQNVATKFGQTFKTRTRKSAQCPWLKFRRVKKRSSTFLNLLFREKRVANNYELSGR